MYRSLYSATLVLFLSSPLASQELISIVVRDSQQPTKLENAVVLDLLTGQTAVTDANGYAEFQQAFAPGSTLELCVSKTGYPVQYFQRLVPDVPGMHENMTNYDVGLTLENQYTTPLLGPSGGSKSFSHGTGEIWDNRQAAPLAEYFQGITGTLAPGALSGNAKGSLSLVPDFGYNNLHVDTLGSNRQIGAQFMFEWLDASGAPIAPTLSSPFRLEMTAGNVVFADVLQDGTWNAQLHKFDENTFSWIPTINGTSGVSSSGILWADITYAGFYSFMVWDSQATTSSPYWNTWQMLDWTSPPLMYEDIFCPEPPSASNPAGYAGGTQTTQGLQETRSFTGKLHVGAGAKSSGLLSKLGLLDFSINGGGEATWTNEVVRNAKWTPGHFIGKHGRVSIVNIGYQLCDVLECLTEEGVSQHPDYDSCSDPIITGTAVKTAALEDC